MRSIREGKHATNNSVAQSVEEQYPTAADLRHFNGARTDRWCAQSIANAPWWEKGLMALASGVVAYAAMCQAAERDRRQARKD